MSELAWAVRSEWDKLWSVRGTSVTLVAVVLASVALTAAVCASLDPVRTGPSEDLVRDALSGLHAGQVAAVVLGVLAVGPEHAHGTAVAGALALPRRIRALLAKTSVVAIVALAGGVVTTVVTHQVGRRLLHEAGFAGVADGALAGGPALRALVGGGLYLAVVAVLGVGVTAWVRHGGAATLLTLGLLLVPFLLTQLLPGGPVRAAIVRSAPMTAGLAVVQTIPGPGGVPLAPWAGLAIAAAWAAGALCLGCWLTARRDL